MEPWFVAMWSQRLWSLNVTELLYCTHTAQASENTTANAWDRLIPVPSAPFTLTTQI